MPDIDPYAVLGVPEHATAEEIKTAYRRLARRFHPDRNPGADAEECFKRVRAAFEALHRTERRAAHAADEQHRRGAAFVFDRAAFEAVFEEIFGTADAVLSISVEEAYSGTQRHLAEAGVSISIPPGTTHGSRLRISSHPSRELRAAVHLRPHPEYAVRGRDVESQIRLHPGQAARGCRTRVHTLAGPVTVTIPPGSREGQRLRLRGRGLPGPRTNTRPGDHWVRLRIEAAEPRRSMH